MLLVISVVMAAGRVGVGRDWEVPDFGVLRKL